MKVEVDNKVFGDRKRTMHVGFLSKQFLALYQDPQGRIY